MLKSTMLLLTAAILALAGSVHAQPPAPGSRPATAPTPIRPRGVQVMALTSSAWSDGGAIPRRYTQAGDDVSPPLAWSGAPDGTMSFVLLVHDADAAIGTGTDDTLHWLYWNIPATATGLAEHVAWGAETGGARQISATGPNYRGPGAAKAGPAHHYVFELFALDAIVEVPAVGQSPQATRAAVVSAMSGHVRGKGVLVGLFRR